MTDVELENFDLRLATTEEPIFTDAEMESLQFDELALGDGDESTSLPATLAVKSSFPYHSMLPMLAKAAQDAAERIHNRLRDAYFDTGADLLLIKRRLDHGDFGRWLKAEFGFSARTAENFMNAATLRQKCESVAVLPATVTYELAAKSTPASVVRQVEADILAGSIPTAAKVRKLIRDAKGALRSQPAAIPVKPANSPSPGVVPAVAAIGDQKSVESARKAVAMIQKELGARFENLRKLMSLVKGSDFLDALNGAPAVTSATSTNGNTVDLSPDE